MAKIKLGSFDIQKLLSSYEANLRQLQFQTEQTKKMIKDLKSALPAIQQAEASEMAAIAESESMIETAAAPAPVKKTAKGKRGRPTGSKAAKKSTTKSKAKKTAAKAAPAAQADSAKKTKTAAKATTKKATAKKATTQKKRSEGYKLSEYDMLVFQALEENGRAMITSDLQTAVEGIKGGKGEKVDAAEVSKMIIRSLQKLANRRSDIKKVAFSGRGMAYALPAWVNNRGAIKPAHKRKDS